MKLNFTKTMAILVVTLGLLLQTGRIIADAEKAQTFPQLRTAIETVRFVGYTPTDLVIESGKVRAANRQQVYRDLKILRRNFQGLVMYSSVDGLQYVPEIAKQLDYRALILGIWDPTSVMETASAVKLAKDYPHLVVGIAVGNETLLAERNDWKTLRSAIRNIRAKLPSVAITTSEPFYFYVDNKPADFLELQDFLLPNVHPVYEPWFNPANPTQAVEYVIQVSMRLAKQTKKPLLIKETGLPSGPESRGFTPKRQAAFWTLLTKTFQSTSGRGLVFFEAFDHAWKVENAREEFGFRPEEAFWGLYTETGKPKLALLDLQRIWKQQNSTQ